MKKSTRKRKIKKPEYCCAGPNRPIPDEAIEAAREYYNLGKNWDALDVMSATGLIFSRREMEDLACYFNKTNTV